MQSQEQRAFVAVLLAMGVLLLWTVLFPPKPLPRTQDVEPSEIAPAPSPGLSEAPGEASGEAPRETDARAEDAAPHGSLVRVLTGKGSVLRQSPGTAAEVRRVQVAGPELSLVIDGRGARVVEAVLPEYHQTETEPVQLVPEQGPGALGSVLVLDGHSVSLDDFVFELISDTRGTEGRRVVWELVLDELRLRKTFVIPPTGHLLRVDHELLEDRIGISGWGLSWGGGMRVTEEQRGHVRGAYFRGSVLAEGKVQRREPPKLAKSPSDFPGHTRFVGVANKYFLGAIVPRGDAQGPARLWQAPALPGEPPSVAGEILVERPPGLAANVVEYDVYVGPLDYARLKELGLGIEGAVDLGMKWIRPLSRTILSFLIWMHGFIPNYGVVIVIFSAMMNLAFFPLTYKSTKSMRDMAALKPRLDALKEKYKDEPQKMSEATMRLYKEAGVNPLAGCMPLLLQMPIFFALYAVLFQTIELRQEPFVFWIRDLSQPDVVFHLPFALPIVGTGIALLPIIMGITSFFQSKQTMVDPNQKMMIYMMPVMMTFIFFTMPSGLVLYWLTSNLFTIGQKFLLKPSTVATTIAEQPDDATPAKRKGTGKGGRRKGAKRPASRTT